MDFETVEKYIFTYDKVSKSHPYANEIAVYSVDVNDEEDPQMFALLEEGKTPIRISLRCDFKLSLLLRERYETVMPGNHLNQKKWNTILLTGQLSWEEVQDLIRLSYNIAAGVA